MPENGRGKAQLDSTKGLDVAVVEARHAAYRQQLITHFVSCRPCLDLAEDCREVIFKSFLPGEIPSA